MTPVPDAVVFDFDGLILDTEWAEYVSICEVFTDHGVELSLVQWQGFIGTTDHPHWTELLATQLGASVDRDTLVVERRRRNSEMLAELEVLPGILDLLDDAAAGGVAVAVASSSPASWVVDHLERIGLAGRFATICTGDDVTETKPSPELFELAVARLGVDPGRAVVIEDSVNGCRAAVAAGIPVVAVPCPLTAGMDFSMAHLVVPSAAELSLERLGRLVSSGFDGGVEPTPRP